jgi:hypothetical protein
MRGAVVSGDACAIEYKHHWLIVHANVKVDLVDRASKEGGVQGYYWPQPTHCHARRRGHCMLLGNANVKHALGKSLTEWK